MFILKHYAYPFTPGGKTVSFGGACFLPLGYPYSLLFLYSCPAKMALKDGGLWEWQAMQAVSSTTFEMGLLGIFWQG